LFGPRERRAVLTGLGGLLAAAVLGNRAQAQTGKPAAQPIKMAVLGDSLVAGYNLPASAAFPAKLQVALAARGIATEIINAGVSGDTSSGGLDRLDWSIPDGMQAVMVELGANDALRGLDPTLTRDALDKILARLKARNMAAFLCGMYAPRNYGPDYIAKFDSIYPDLAKKYGVPLYPFFLEGVAGVSKLNQPDGLHPTAEGVDAIVKGILPAVEAWLRPMQVQAG
jgi:acyl-CoA thioesterase-1